MRLVLSGYYGYGNAGDEWVLAGLLAQFRSLDPSLHVTVLSGDPAATERTHSVAAVRRTSVPAVTAALRGSDALVSGGGSLLQDSTSARPVSYYVAVMQMARLLGRPYAIVAQGLGPIRRRVNRRIAALGLQHAAYVSLRDEGSVTLARRIGVRGPIELVPDPALALRPARSGASQPYLLVAVRDWPAGRDHLAQLRSAIATVAGSIPVIALPMQEPADRRPSVEVVSGIRQASVVPAEATLDERLAIIGSASVVVGMRLHSLIIAAAAGVPAVAISYDPKVDAFAKLVGQPIGGAVADGFDSVTLAALIREQLVTESSAYRARVDALRGRLHQSAGAALAALGHAPDATAGR